MKGIIFLWYGAIVNIPSGWALCDGTQGTPNLKNQFVGGAGTTWDPGDKVTFMSHKHFFTGDGHKHVMAPGDRIGIGPDYAEDITTDPAAGRTNATTALPPYHALCYIMKLP